jgi:heat shock protein HslJ
MKHVKIILVSCGILLIFACSCSKSKELANVPLLKTQWILSHFQNATTNKIINYPDSLRIKESITFTDSLTLSIETTCGKTNVGYSIKDDSISIPQIAFYTSSIYCGLVQWENYLLFNLDSAFKFNLKANQLIIYSKGTYNLFFVSGSSK